MRISDWSSDVCSSDLLLAVERSARAEALVEAAHLDGSMAAQRHPGSVQVGPRDRRGRPGRQWRRFVARYRAQALHIGEGRPDPRVVEGGRPRLHPGGVDPAVVVGEHADPPVPGPYTLVPPTALPPPAP